MGVIFGFTIVGTIFLVIGVVLGWNNADGDGDIYACHCVLTIVGVAFIAVALFKVYLLTEGIDI